MYMSILGKPTDQDLDQYPHVILQYWIMHIQTPVVIHPGYLIHQLEISMTPGLMNEVTSKAE